MHQPEKAVLDLITDGMTVDLHVLGTFVEHRICSNVDRRLAVTEELRLSCDHDAKKREKFLKP